jgi:hypothetical protein
MRDPARSRARQVHTLRTFPAPAPRSVGGPRGGAEAMRLLRQRLHDDPGTITSLDLANVAGACHRVALLTARAARDQPQPDQTFYDRAVAAAGHWRRLQVALRDVKPLGPPADHAAVAVTIAGWAARHLRPDNPVPLVADHNTRSWREWTASLQEATAYLPDLARLAGRHLIAQLHAGSIVAEHGVDWSRRYSPPTAEHVNRLVQLLDTVNAHSVDLARHTLAANPGLHPVPHVVERAERLAGRSVWPGDALSELHLRLAGAVRDERARWAAALAERWASTGPDQRRSSPPSSTTRPAAHRP